MLYDKNIFSYKKGDVIIENRMENRSLYADRCVYVHVFNIQPRMIKKKKEAMRKIHKEQHVLK